MTRNIKRPNGFCFLMTLGANVGIGLLPCKEKFFKNIFLTSNRALVYTALLMPIRVAFITDDLDDGEWTAMDWISDGIFFVDIFINFFSAYFNSDDNLITNRKVTMRNSFNLIN